MQNAVSTDTISKILSQKPAASGNAVSRRSTEMDPKVTDDNGFEDVFEDETSITLSEELPDPGLVQADALPESTAVSSRSGVLTATTIASEKMLRLSGDFPEEVRTVSVRGKTLASSDSLKLPVDDGFPEDVQETRKARSVYFSADSGGIKPSAENDAARPGNDEHVDVDAPSSREKAVVASVGAVAAAVSHGVPVSPGRVQTGTSAHATEDPRHFDIASVRGREDAPTFQRAPDQKQMTGQSEGFVGSPLPVSVEKTVPESAKVIPVPVPEPQIKSRHGDVHATPGSSDVSPVESQFRKESTESRRAIATQSTEQSSHRYPGAGNEGAEQTIMPTKSLSNTPEMSSSNQSLSSDISVHSPVVTSSDIAPGARRSLPSGAEVAYDPIRERTVYSIQADPVVTRQSQRSLSTVIPGVDQATPDWEFTLTAGDTSVLQRNVAAASMLPLPQAGPAQFAQISQQLMEIAMRHSDGPVELMLSPEELGRVKMNFAVQDGGLTVTVAAERSETLALIRRHIDILLQDFQEVGFSGVNLEFSEHDPTGSSGDFGEDDSAYNDNPADDQVVADPSGSAPVRINVMSGAGSGLDLRL